MVSYCEGDVVSAIATAARISRVAPQARVSGEKLPQRTRCLSESSDRQWKVTLVLYTTEDFLLIYVVQIAEIN